MAYTDNDHSPNIIEPASFQDYGRWLDSFPNSWCYWFTGTFEFKCSINSARRAVQRYLKKTGVSLAFWVSDCPKWRESSHIHGLMQFEGNAPSANSLFKDWLGTYGRAHVDKFDPEKGAAFYLSKHIESPRADWDFIGTDFDQSLSS